MIQGYIERVQAFRIQGWAYDSQNPERHLTVEIICGDVLLGTVRANLFREDLREGAIGDGNHAFIFDILYPLSNDDLLEIGARVITPVGAVPLARLIYTPEEVPADDAVSAAFGGTASDADQSPLFIQGSTRSGTSAFAQAITATGHFWGQKEGQLLDLFAHLRDAVRAFYDEKQRAGAINGVTFISRVPMAFFQKGFRDMFIELIRTAVPSPYWFDKMPNHHMIQLVPHFLAMWPKAKFVFLKRRAPELIESRRRRARDLRCAVRAAHGKIRLRDRRNLSPARRSASLADVDPAGGDRRAHGSALIWRVRFQAIIQLLMPNAKSSAW